MRRKYFTILFCASVASILLPALARACAVCLTGADDPTADAFNASVLFLMATPYLVIGSIAGWLYYKYRRATVRPVAEATRQPAMELIWKEEESGR